MKKLLSMAFLAISSLILVASSCKKEEGVAALPQATQIGKNTFGCLVNGKAFLPKGSLFASPVQQCFYQYITGTDKEGYYFHVGARQETKKECEMYSISIDAALLTLEENKTYILKNRNSGIVVGEVSYYPSCQQNTIVYTTTSNITGELKITKFDQVNQIVSGTFWFDAVNAQGEKVEVREGRFDMQFTK